MPWKECHVKDERLRFVARLLDPRWRSVVSLRCKSHRESAGSLSANGQVRLRRHGFRTVESDERGRSAAKPPPRWSCVPRRM
jgi:hypothetical protein